MSDRDQENDAVTAKVKKTGSGKKKKQPNSSEKKRSREFSHLNELKQQGRRLRSANKDASLAWSLMEGLTITELESQPRGVGLAYDDCKMLEHQSIWDTRFPDNPVRLSRVIEKCKEYGLIERCENIPVSSASEEDILLCHSKDYYDLIKSTSTMTEDELKTVSTNFDAVHFNTSSYDAAVNAVGAVLGSVDGVCKGKFKRSMSLVRPPGHHAMRSEGNGYCIFNSAAIAAKHAVKNLGKKRVLIVDWDIHHGQGIQQQFYDDARVLYFSTHRYEHGNFWPNLRESAADFVGEKKGKGFNINVPINSTGLKNGDFLAIFMQILLPVAFEYAPDLVIICAGYDSAIGCPEGRNELTPAIYSHFINLLKPLADGNICVILEGGYCIKSLAESAALTLMALLDDPCPRIEDITEPLESTVDTILNVILAHQPYWRCFKYQIDASVNIKPENLIENQASSEFMFRAPASVEIPLIDDYCTNTKEEEVLLDAKINALIQTTDLSKAPNRNCIVYDVEMRRHKCVSMPGHPERPDRISRIYEKHVDCGLVKRSKTLPSRQATDKELLLCHSTQYIETVKGFSRFDQQDLLELEHAYNSIYISPEAEYCARLAAGCTLNVVKEVCSKQSQSGVAIVRPPGHHAEVRECCGFCYFNNVALAAEYAQQQFDHINKVLILDWDVHHGNGTQNMFYTNPNVLYISIHRHDNGFFFPSGDGGNWDKIGEKPGEGFNVNIPWNSTNIGDAEYIAAFQQIVMPISYEFNPDLVLVSAGFDAARGDPLGCLKISPEGYAAMTQMLMGLANGNVILVLEGGYNLVSISESLAMCTSVLLGDRCPRLQPLHVSTGGVQTINRVLDVQKKYWKSLKFRVELPIIVKKESPGKDIDKHIIDQMDSLSVEDNPSDPIFEETLSANTSLDDELLRDVGRLALAPNLDVSANEAVDHSLEKLEQSLKVVEISGGKLEDSKPTTDAAAILKEASCTDTDNDGAIEQKSHTIKSASIKTMDIGIGVNEPEGHNELEGAVGGLVEGSRQAKTVHQIVKKEIGPVASNKDLFAVVPLSWCDHLSSVSPVPDHGLDVEDSCIDCGHVGENWVCLVCYQVHCSRYINEHMLMHGCESEHRLVLSYADLSVWCYACDNYVHNPVLLEAKQAAHQSKFKQSLPGY